MLAAKSACASEAITLTPAQGQAVTVQARIGQKLFKVNSGAVQTTIASRRFIVKLSDLNNVMPGKGDTITWKGRVYRLGCPDGGPVWRWHGNACADIAIYAIDFGAVVSEQSQIYGAGQ